MMAREGWKYVELKETLDLAGVRHAFEERLPGSTYLYDLLLPDRKIAIEFDGPYHSSPSQRNEDEQKDLHATAVGWEIVRIQTKPSAIIPADALSEILRKPLHLCVDEHTFV